MPKSLTSTTNSEILSSSTYKFYLKTGKREKTNTKETRQAGRQEIFEKEKYYAKICERNEIFHLLFLKQKEKQKQNMQHKKSGTKCEITLEEIFFPVCLFHLLPSIFFVFVPSGKYKQSEKEWMSTWRYVDDKK